MARKKSRNKFKDSDADGLPDGLEKKLGTNPRKADSDEDGVGDYEEVNIYGTDPLKSDTDGDGMSDGEEIRRGRNPRGPGRLKDLFIPHAGNNYKPHALRPHRLLFHALSAVLIKITLIGAVIILPVEAWLTPDILIEQSKKIIGLTNEIRKNLNLGVLAENNQLSQAAFDKAQDMLLSQYFAHAGPDGRRLSDWLKINLYDYAIAGENLAMGFSNPEEVVNGWSRSKTHYQNMIDPDFSQIGVGLAAGSYQNYDTTFVAQYFGAPRQVKAAIAPPSIAPAASPAAPPVDASLTVDRPAGQSSQIVRAEASLPEDTVKASVNFNNYEINLNPDPAGRGLWTGRAVIFKEDREQIFKPVILPTLTAQDSGGNTNTTDIGWSNITPLATSLSDQYFFIKQHQSPLIKPLFDLTSIYYKVILIIALMALILNIFIQIKKQHPHIILSTLGLIGLLTFLIIL